MLSAFVLSQLFAFLLVFCRAGTALMLMPGFGELYVPSRVRLLLAALFSFTLSQAMSLPPPPVSVSGLFALMLGEMLAGAFLGSLCRMMIAAVHVTGTIVAFQSSMSSALTLDITQFSGQDTSLGNFFTMTAMVLLLVTDLHHVMLKGIADSYNVFTPGQFPMVQDMADHMAQTMSAIFRAAMAMAAPNIVIGTMLYLGAGIIARLMPNMQVFFILMAPQLLLSFFLIMITISAVMMYYLDFFRATLGSFLAP